MTVDLSFAALFRSAAGYRVTGQFEGVDLVNGGKHEATDVGNFGMNDPILAPITGMARGMRHFDGALGVDYDIGNGWHVQLWHLNATQAPLDTWVPVVKGQICGRTGNTGALVNGQPMPAHTHVELERAGVRYDIEPYLLGKPFETGASGEDDMIIRKPLVREQWTTKTGDFGWFKRAHDGVVGQFTTAEKVWSTAELTLSDGANARLIEFNGDPLIILRAHLISIPGTRTVGITPVAADCSAQDAKLTEARLGVAALRTQHTEEGAALEGVARALGT